MVNNMISAVLSVFLAAEAASTAAAWAPIMTIRLGILIAFLAFGHHAFVPFN